MSQVEEEHAEHQAMLAKHGIVHSEEDKRTKTKNESMQFAMVHGHMDLHVQMTMDRRRTYENDLPVRACNSSCYVLLLYSSVLLLRVSWTYILEQT